MSITASLGDRGKVLPEERVVDVAAQVELEALLQSIDLGVVLLGLSVKNLLRLLWRVRIVVIRILAS